MLYDLKVSTYVLAHYSLQDYCIVKIPAVFCCHMICLIIDVFAHLFYLCSFYCCIDFEFMQMVLFVVMMC